MIDERRQEEIKEIRLSKFDGVESKVSTLVIQLK